MTESSRSSLWRIVQAAAVVVVLALFLFEMRSILNPVLLFMILWAVLLPFRGSDGHTALLTVSALLTGAWLFAATGTLLSPLFLAIVLAYILDPLVDIVEERGMSRSLAVMLLTVPAVAAVAAIVLLIVPAAFGQLGQALESAPVLFERLGNWIEARGERLLSVDLPFFDGQEIVERIRAVDAEAVVEFLRERQDDFAQYMWTGVLGLGRGLGSVAAFFGYVILTPVLTFYLIRDWDLVTERIVRLVPEPRRSTFVSFAGECDTLVSSYLRGQLLVAITIGLMTGVGLGIARFPYAASLGLMVGVFSLVPYLGLILSLIPAIFIALVSGSVMVSLLKIAVVYGTVQALDATVVTPRIVGESVGIHPVWVVLALSLGGYFFGVVGLLIGVPAAAVTKLLVLRGLERYEASDFYRGADVDPVG